MPERIVRVRNWKETCCHSVASMLKHPLIRDNGHDHSTRPGVYMGRFESETGHSILVGFDQTKKVFVVDTNMQESSNGS